MDRQDDGSQSREFVERLARRSNDPAGVIDVRYAQQKYARIVDWLGERFGLLDQMRARYGADEGIAADWQTDWQTMVMQQSVGEQINLFSTSTQSLFTGMAAQPFGNARAFSSEAPSSLAEITTPRSTKPADESPSTAEPKYRISRRRQPIASSSAMTSSEHHSQPTSTTASGSGPQKAVEPIKQSDDVPHAIEAPFTTRTPPSLVFAEPLIEPEDQSQPKAPKAPKRSELREASADQSPGSATDRAVSGRFTHTGPEVVRAPSEPSITPVPPASPRSEASEHTRDSSLPLASPRSEASEHTRDSSLPLARPLAQPQRADDPQQTGAGRSTLSRTMPEIVWRNSPEPQALTYLASGEQGRRVTDSARQVNDSADSVITRQATIDGAVPGNLQTRDESRKDDIRIEQLSPQVIRTISERVIRTISLDLKVERERRGISKWR